MLVAPTPIRSRRRGAPDLRRLADEAHALAARVRPDLEGPRRGRAEYRRRARAFATVARSYAHNRRLDRDGREDLRPLYFIWTLLRSCNFTCAYCDDHRGRKYPELPNDGVLSTQQGIRLLEVMRTGTPSVYFAGGEPTLRKDLPELTRAARDLDYYPILINTNGSAVDRLLAKPSHRAWLADTDVVIVSLDALDLGVLERMWVYRRPEEVIRNLFLLSDLAQEMRVKLMVNCVIQPGMVRHAREVFELTQRLGVWFCPVPMNVGPTIERRLLEDPEYLEFSEQLLDEKRAGARITGSPRMNRRLLRAEALHCRNSLKPHVDYDGRLVWPCKAAVNVPPEYVNVLDFDDVHSLYAHASSLIDPTRFHGPARNQCGADCNWAQNYSTDAYAHGLRHPTSLLGEIGELLRRS